MFIESDIRLSDGRNLHVYDTAGASDDTRLTVIWHHGTPNIGWPPEPLFHPAIRWLSFDRPGYGKSTSDPGRSIASVSRDVTTIADEFEIDRFAVTGHSGGATHALGLAAVAQERVSAVVAVAGLAPFSFEQFDWWNGMRNPGTLQAATKGRDAVSSYLAEHEWDPEEFTPADHAALAGDWSWLGRVAGHGLDSGLDGMIDDELAYVSPWDCAVAEITAPVLLVHGEQDRIVPSAHAEHLAQTLGTTQAQLWLLPTDGHISILHAAPLALDWLLQKID